MAIIIKILMGFRIGVCLAIPLLSRVPRGCDFLCRTEFQVFLKNAFLSK